MAVKKDPLIIFSGPCVLESEDLAMEIAGKLKEDLSIFGDEVKLYFKGSFDKANRTSFDSYRGPGIEKGLAILEKVKKDFGLPVITDFHLPEQADAVASVVDVLQVPAFLCRQTDLILAGAKACHENNSILKIKKGQFLSPEETENIVKKAGHYLKKDQIYLTERGTSFGYNNLVVDMASFQIMKSFGVKAIHDATHCVQKPGGLGTATGGKRDQILTLAKAAVASGADGVFMESHPNPAKALSDSATCLELGKVQEIVQSLLAIYRVV
ncbi:3-deoxy-8-phosphooctulonate synthase [Bacteriovoracaceae bacterium]|nr:3-deoxy-8-phosphooctulonate synthase [Bacteriovoracaceae bacterium]